MLRVPIAHSRFSMTSLTSRDHADSDTRVRTSRTFVEICLLRLARESGFAVAAASVTTELCLEPVKIFTQVLQLATGCTLHSTFQILSDAVGLAWIVQETRISVFNSDAANCRLRSVAIRSPNVMLAAHCLNREQSISPCGAYTNTE
nr:hypothetical protein CFP56_38961 [Quercus suber]